MAPLANKQWEGGYRFQPFTISTTQREFAYSRRGIGSARAGKKLIPSNLSTIYTPYAQATLVSGVLQGRKQSDPRGASFISRRGIWKAVSEVYIAVLGVQVLRTVVERCGGSYVGVKEGEGRLRVRRGVKEEVLGRALRGWGRGVVDDFRLDLNENWKAS